MKIQRGNPALNNFKDYGSKNKKPRWGEKRQLQMRSVEHWFL